MDALLEPVYPFARVLCGGDLLCVLCPLTSTCLGKQGACPHGQQNAAQDEGAQVRYSWNPVNPWQQQN